MIDKVMRHDRMKYYIHVASSDVDPSRPLAISAYSDILRIQLYWNILPRTNMQPSFLCTAYFVKCHARRLKKKEVSAVLLRARYPRKQTVCGQLALLMNTIEYNYFSLILYGHLLCIQFFPTQLTDSNFLVSYSKWCLRPEIRHSLPKKSLINSIQLS